jgi:serine/threonine protein phosphatase 1
MKIVIIGDIHGCHKELVQLLEALPKDIEKIYSVGDLIDRGPESKKVVQECIDRGIICVRGNHEDMFLDFLDGCKRYSEGIFIQNGGGKTIRDYGGESFEIKGMYGSSNHTSNCEVPDNHLKFMKAMPYFIETDDFILTHGGVPEWMGEDFRDKEPGSEVELMWNRGRTHGDLGKVQISGHTPVQEPHLVKGAINIDTGCIFGNKLSALILPSMEVISVKGHNSQA